MLRVGPCMGYRKHYDAYTKVTQRNKIFKKCFGEQGVKFGITKIISQSDFYS